MELNKIYQGSALEILQTFEDESIDCCITSPPYWSLRDYGVEGQLGLEPTFELYISHLMQIFNEVKRVLKKTGTCWVNLGDTYAGSNGVCWKETIENTNRKVGGDKSNTCLKKDMGMRDLAPSKSLCCIPDRFKIAMVDSEDMDEYELREDLTEEERKYVLTELLNRGII